MPAYILLIVGVLYLVELAFYSFAGRRARKPHKGPYPFQKLPKVSVVVAAKDEEEHLPACLASLVKVDYPRDLLEIIIVNDQSVDSTPAVIDRFAGEYGFVRRVDAVEGTDMRGKANALSQGIDSAQGEFILLTDADCSVPVTWISGTLKHFEEKTGIVGGVTLILKADNVLSGVQSLDWDFLLSIGSAAATIRKPLACLGNNLAFRKKAYEDVGGYRKIRFSVTEDYALFKAISESGRWDYHYPMDRQTLVETLPLRSLKEVFAQRKRWATGGKDTGFFGVVTLAPGFLFHWGIIVTAILSPASFPLLLLVKLVLDALFVFPVLKFYGKIAHLKFIVYFEIYYLIYVAILPFSVYLGKAITWKGRKY